MISRQSTDCNHFKEILFMNKEISIVEILSMYKLAGIFLQ